MRGAQPWRTNRARTLRANETSAEEQLWQALRGRRFKGLKFVRQMPVGPYFADFACRNARIIVEVDGATHATSEQTERDNTRSEPLEQQGYRIYRVRNDEIYENLDGVLDTLSAFIDELKD